MTTADLLQEFLDDHKLKGNSPATADYYDFSLRAFIAHCPHAEDVTEANVKDWRMELVKRKLSSTTIRSYDRAARAFVAWMEVNGHVEHNPFGQIPRPKSRKAKLSGFTQAEVLAMLRAIDNGPQPTRLRNRALVTILLDTGTRIGEQANMELGDVQWADSTIVVTGKTGPRAVPFGAPTRKALRSYLQRGRKAPSDVRSVWIGRSGEPMQANSLGLTVRRIVTAIGVRDKKIGPHSFRHTFALEYLRSGGDVFSLMRILGHANIKTTEEYVSWLAPDLRVQHDAHSPAGRWL